MDAFDGIPVEVQDIIVQLATTTTRMRLLHTSVAFKRVVEDVRNWIDVEVSLIESQI